MAGVAFTEMSQCLLMLFWETEQHWTVLMLMFKINTPELMFDTLERNREETFR